MLVHGGFVDGSGWEGVFELLRKDGYAVSIVQNPTMSLADDVAATRRVIAAADGPVILVGHSYGGVVITQAGNDPRLALREAAVVDLAGDGLAPPRHCLRRFDRLHQRGSGSWSSPPTRCAYAAFDANILGVAPDYVVPIRRDALEEHDGPMLTHGLEGDGRPADPGAARRVARAEEEYLEGRTGGFGRRRTGDAVEMRAQATCDLRFRTSCTRTSARASIFTSASMLNRLIRPPTRSLTRG